MLAVPSRQIQMMPKKVVQKRDPKYPCLLRSTLNSFSTWMSILVVLVHGCCSLSSCLLTCVNIFKVYDFSHGLGWRCDGALVMWKDCLQCFKCSRIGGEVLLGEFHVELDEEVAEIVMSE